MCLANVYSLNKEKIIFSYLKRLKNTYLKITISQYYEITNETTQKKMLYCLYTIQYTNVLVNTVGTPYTLFFKVNKYKN